MVRALAWTILPHLEGHWLTPVPQIMLLLRRHIVTLSYNVVSSCRRDRSRNMFKTWGASQEAAWRMQHCIGVELMRNDGSIVRQWSVA